MVVFDVLDDCTRLLAACQAADAETAAAAVAAITAAAAACGAPGIVLCDNGGALTGGPHARGTQASAFARAVTALGARLIHSSPYHPQTCGKVERHHQTLKRWLAAQPRQPATLAELQMLLDAYRDYYNTRRHHTALGATPRHGLASRRPTAARATCPARTTPPSTPSPSPPTAPPNWASGQTSTSAKTAPGRPSPPSATTTGSPSTPPPASPSATSASTTTSTTRAPSPPPHNRGHIITDKPATQLPRQHTE